MTAASTGRLSIIIFMTSMIWWSGSFWRRPESSAVQYEGERDLKVVVSKLTEQLLENKAFIINAFYSVNRRQLEKFLQELARPALTDIAAGYAEGRHISQEDQEFVVNIFNFALIGLVTEWVGSGMDTAFIKDIDRFYKVLDGTMEGGRFRSFPFIIDL